LASKLFSPLKIGKIELENRITVSAMCQYSAVNGSMTDWHRMHIGNLALSGASLFMIESTAVTADGRISPGCAGLYSDENEAALSSVLKFVRSISPIRIGVQLGHAGRKGSAPRPWEGTGALSSDKGGWQTVAPSAIALGPGWPVPVAIDRAGMESLKNSYVEAAKRALRAGVDFIEFHSTHGYLIAEFLSPLSNKRTDEFGGSLQNRMRFPLEVFAAIRAVWPADRVLGSKITGTDFADGGITPEECVAYARALQSSGCDYVTVSGGGTVLDAKVPLGPGYQVPFAEKIKRETGLVTGAVGLISDPQQAEDIISEGRADFVALARAMLFNPRWGTHAAVQLGAEATYARQYARSQPKFWPPGAKLGHIA
jgi:2,4-dienoyl-CoA reductase-like NADH-dependent reductase (Old Yellow Enzyme family)